MRSPRSLLLLDAANQSLTVSVTPSQIEQPETSKRKREHRSQTQALGCADHGLAGAPAADGGAAVAQGGNAAGWAAPCRNLCAPPCFRKCAPWRGRGCAVAAAIADHWPGPRIRRPPWRSDCRGNRYRRESRRPVAARRWMGRGAAPAASPDRRAKTCRPAPRPARNRATAPMPPWSALAICL